MSDPVQAKAVRLQSSAIVMAAVITTCGAVTSALIQTGLTSKLPTVSLGSVPAGMTPMESAPPRTEKSSPLVAETIDVPPELLIAAAQLPAKSQPLSTSPAATTKAAPAKSPPISSAQTLVSKAPAAKPQTFSASASRATFHAPIPEPTATTTNSGGKSWNVAKAELPSSATGAGIAVESQSDGSPATRQLVSPWYYLQQPLSADRQAANSTQKKSFDWLKLPSWLQPR